MVNEGNEFKCENCGGNSLIVIDNVPTCGYCGTKYPGIKKENLSIDEELREEEIINLTNSTHKKYNFAFSGIILTIVFIIGAIDFWRGIIFHTGFHILWAITFLLLIIFVPYASISYFRKRNNQNAKPKQNILTDDEILKYAPYSKATKSIIWRRNGGWKEFLKKYWILFIISFIFSISSLFLYCIVVFVWSYDNFVKK